MRINGSATITSKLHMLNTTRPQSQSDIVKDINQGGLQMQEGRKPNKTHRKRTKAAGIKVNKNKLGL